MHLFKGKVTHVIDPSNFWIRYGTNSALDRFQTYQGKLNDFYNDESNSEGTRCSIDHLSPGCPVVTRHWVADDQGDHADHPKNAHWERAKVMRVDITSNCVDVFFIDLGYSAIVSVEDCREIFDAIFNYIPEQAYLVGLAGIKPLAKSWTSRASNLLQTLTLNADIVTVPVCQISETEVSESEVVIYTRLNDGSWHSLSHEMQHNEMALGTVNITEEFLTDYFVKKCVHRADQYETDSKIDEEEEERTSPSQPQVKVQKFNVQALSKARSVSVSKLKEEKEYELQKQMTSKIQQSLQRQESIAGNSEDQDFGNVPDTDFYANISSQIHDGFYDDGHNSNDGGLGQLLRESYGIATGPRIPSQRSPSPIETKDIQEDKAIEMDEIQIYQLEKKIKEILANKDGIETECLWASVYSVIEPDMDTSKQSLKVVICAVLEHVMMDETGDSDVELSILETYSDACVFVDAMTEVLVDMKSRFIKRYPGFRMMNVHIKFARVLASVFQQVEDWGDRICVSLQDHIATIIERWIIFNRHRKLSGDKLNNSELMYVECAQKFFSLCGHMLKNKYAERVDNLLAEMRSKLVQDGTPSDVRSCLLCILLAFQLENPEQALKGPVTCHAATQTDPLPEDADNSQTVSQVPHLPLHAENKSFLSDMGDTNQNQNMSVNSRHSPPAAESNNYFNCPRKDRRLPKSIRNLPPRLMKKCFSDFNTSQPSAGFRDNEASSSLFSDSQTIPPETIPLETQIFPLETESESKNSSSVLPSPESTWNRNEDEHKKEQLSVSNGTVHSLTCTVKDTMLLNGQNGGVHSETVQTAEVWDANTVVIDGEHNDHELKNDSVEDNSSPAICHSSNEDLGSIHVLANVCQDRKSLIRYTPSQLRIWNPFQDQPKLELWDLWEPKEVLEKMIVKIPPRKSSEEASCFLTDLSRKSSQLNPSATKFIPSTFFSGNTIRYEKEDSGSSVDPVPKNAESESCSSQNVSNSLEESLLNDSVFSHSSNVESTRNVSNGSLRDIGTDLAKTKMAVPEHEEVWHDDSFTAGALKPTKIDSSPGFSKKGKKKKTKGKPLDEFLQEQAAKKLEESFDFEGDEVCPEALEMYEELERQGVGLNTPPPVRKSFTSLQSGSPKMWCPSSKRFCTRCGSADHIVYDCQEIL